MSNTHHDAAETLASPVKKSTVPVDRHLLMKNITDVIQCATEELAKDLSGYATQVAMKTFLDNWRAAILDGNTDFSLTSMVDDIDQTIHNLNCLKIGISREPGAEQVMRKTLGILPTVAPKNRI